MHWSRRLVLLAVVLAVGSSSRGLTGESSAFERMTAHYESIRQTLLHDSSEDVAAEAGQIEQLLQALKAMVRYRQLVSEPAPVVVFCSMAQKVWLQPKGEIGNPYYGQSMARCGEIVSQ